MDVPTILSTARTLTHTASNMVGLSDADLLPYLNESYHVVENVVATRVDEDFFYEIFTQDTAISQQDYRIETSSSTQDGMNKITQVEIKRNADDTYYQKLPRVDVERLDKTPDYYTSSQAQADGFYDLKRDRIFIYPAPDTLVVDWLKVRSIVNLIDLTTTSTESEIFPNASILRQYHYVVRQGLMYYIYQIKQQNDKASIAYQERLDMRETMVEELSDRTNAPRELSWFYDANFSR